MASTIENRENRENRMVVRYDSKSLTTVKAALGIACLFSSMFSRKQKQNARIAGDKFSENLWSFDESMDIAVGTGLAVSAMLDLIK